MKGLILFFALSWIRFFICFPIEHSRQVSSNINFLSIKRLAYWQEIWYCKNIYVNKLKARNLSHYLHTWSATMVDLRLGMHRYPAGQSGIFLSPVFGRISGQIWHMSFYTLLIKLLLLMVKPFYFFLNIFIGLFPYIFNYNIENWVWTRTLAAPCCLLSGLASSLEDMDLLVWLTTAETL